VSYEVECHWILTAKDLGILCSRGVNLGILTCIGVVITA